MADKEIVVKDDMVVSMEYTLRVDGEIIDQSEPGEPIQFIQGIGQVVPGLEDALSGMRVGERNKVTIPSEEGYGEIDEDAVAEIPADDFPDDIPLEPGVGLILKDDEGDEQEAYIVEVDDDTVYLSLNHPLAGEELEFDIKVVGLREADDEELDHGHVHPDS